MTDYRHNIQMVDLQGQYQKVKSEIDQAIQDCIQKSAFINGPDVSFFAGELATYLGARHVIPVANGTDALQIAMMALDLKPGDEVIVPAFTYVATAEVIALLGLTPVWIDVEEYNFTLDVDRLDSLITTKTKAIVPVHLYGQCADMEPLLQFAKRHQIHVIEDNAQAIGADYIFNNGNRTKGGLLGDIGCTSFFPSKNLGCFGDGGAIYTQNTELAEKIQMIANHGQKKKYFHDIVGVNSRLDTLQAAILRVKLKYLDAYIKARQQAAATYDSLLNGLPDIELPHRATYSTHVFHQYTLKIANGKRDALKKYLESNGIPTMIYYPVPMHLQKAYRNDTYPQGSFPVAEKLCDEVLSLPIHTELSEETQVYITQKIKDFFSA